MKKLFLVFFIVLGAFAQNIQAQNIIKWMSWEEAIAKNEKNPKKIFVDVYTDWCGWCKKMDKATFQQDDIARYMNEHYYSVKFDAEQKEDIYFKEKTYKYVSQGKRGYHELAAAMLRGKLSYPTVIFLDEEMNMIQPIPGFQNPTNFELIMTFFAEDHFKNTPWKKYTQSYQSRINALPVSGN